MIIFDYIGHMVSTDSAEELHSFAQNIGLKRRWYQTPGPDETHAHYDLTTKRMMKKAEKMGAKKVHPFDLMDQAWWAPNLKGG